MKPEVSVIIPTYNSEEYLAQALKSVFAQTHSNFEIILVDDASTDSTVQIARSFADSRLRIIANQVNGGVSSARNLGIKEAQGKWIALLDSDDWYAPERLASLLKIAAQENADMIADDLFLIYEQEKYPWSTLLQENQPRRSHIEVIDAARFVTTDRPAPINAPRNWSFGYTKPLMRREFLLNHGIKYDESINVGEDFILYLECLQNNARFLLVSRPYYFYRTREQSLSTRKPTEYLAQSCRITEKFIVRAQSAAVINESLVKALQQNLKIFKQRLAYYRAIECIKARKIWGVLVQVFRCPYILIYFTNKLITVLEHKTLLLSTPEEREYLGLTFD